MNCDLLSDVSSQALIAGLRGRSTRHLALARNVANADTPGYRRVEVNFEPALSSALARARREPGRAGALLSAVSCQPSPDHAALARPDGNTVDIDREMVGLARNTLGYRAAGELLGARIRMLRTALQRGPR